MAQDIPPVLEQVLDPSTQRANSTVDWFGMNHEFPLRPQTTVQPLVCGEIAFAAVARALRRARRSINMCFWGLDPAMLLERGTAGNWNNDAILGEILLDKALEQNVKVRILVWNHYQAAVGSGGSGEADPTDADLGGNSANLAKFYALARRHPNIEVHMVDDLSNNWTPMFPSFHQKSIIVDIETPGNSTAFVMGHNMLVNYWSTKDLRKKSDRRQFYLRATREYPDNLQQTTEQAGLMYEYYQANPPPGQDATGSVVERFRQEYEDLQGATRGNRFIYRTERSLSIKPYLDVSTQLWGQAVVDVYKNFERVCRHNSIALPVPPSISNVSAFQPKSQRNAAMVAATFPLATPPARDIEKFYRNAIQNADRYVLIVNQYFRNWPLSDEIIAWWARERQIPQEKKVPMMVVTNNWNLPENIDELGWLERKSARAQAGHDGVTLKKFRDAGVPISMTKMKTEEPGIHSTVYVHAKLLIVDDVFYTIGSANYNRRGFESDPELNIGVVDGNEALRLRREIMNVLVGDPMNEFNKGQDPMNAFKVWEQYVALNSAAATGTGKLPHGRVVKYSPVLTDPTDETGNRRASVDTPTDGPAIV